MKFPKPLVILGFILIIAGASAGIYKSFFKHAATTGNNEAKMKIAGVVVDQIFEKLKNELQSDLKNFEEADFAKFKEIHMKSCSFSYVSLADELSTGKYSKEEALKKDKEFNDSSVKKLKEIYLRKFPPDKIFPEK